MKQIMPKNDTWLQSVTYLLIINETRPQLKAYNLTWSILELASKSNQKVEADKAGYILQNVSVFLKDLAQLHLITIL